MRHPVDRERGSFLLLRWPVGLVQRLNGSSRVTPAVLYWLCTTCARHP